MVRVRGGGGGGQGMCEHGQHGVLSARSRSGRAKELGVWRALRATQVGGGSRGAAPRKFTNFRPS